MFMSANPWFSTLSSVGPGRSALVFGCCCECAHARIAESRRAGRTRVMRCIVVSPAGCRRDASSDPSIPFVPLIAPVAAVALGEEENLRQVLRALVTELHRRVDSRG